MLQIIVRNLCAVSQNLSGTQVYRVGRTIKRRDDVVLQIFVIIRIYRLKSRIRRNGGDLPSNNAPQNWRLLVLFVLKQIAFIGTENYYHTHTLLVEGTKTTQFHKRSFQWTDGL